MLGILTVAAVAILLTAWVLYPAAVAVVASFARPQRPASRQAHAPTVSVIIAARAEPPVIRERLEDIARSDYERPKLEIIVALDTSNAHARHLDVSHLGIPIRFIERNGAGGKAAGLNAGVAHATGEILVFTDVHQRFHPTAIHELVTAFVTPRVGAATGHFDLGSPSDRRGLIHRYWAMERRLRRHESHIHSPVGVTGAIYAMRRTLWNELPIGLILDDLYVPMQLILDGYRVAFAERARAVDVRSPSPQEEYRRKVRTLTGVIQLCRWFPVMLNPFRNPIWFQFTCHKLLRLLTPYALAIVAIWVFVTTASSLGSGALWAGLVAAIGFAVLASGSYGARLRRLVLEGALLQFAVVIAGFNGLFARWDVWHG